MTGDKGQLTGDTQQVTGDMRQVTHAKIVLKRYLYSQHTPIDSFSPVWRIFSLFTVTVMSVCQDVCRRHLVPFFL